MEGRRWITWEEKAGRVGGGRGADPLHSPLWESSSAASKSRAAVYPLLPPRPQALPVTRGKHVHISHS